MKSRIKKTLRNIVLTGAGLAGSLGLISNSGCDSYGNPYPSTQAAAGSVAAQHVATTNPNLTSNQVQGFGALGSLLGMVAQQEAMKEAARQGRSEVNVYTGTGDSGLRSPKSKRDYPTVFTLAKPFDAGSSLDEVEYTQIFHKSDDKVWICGDFSDIYPEGTKMRNRVVFVKTGEKFRWFVKPWGIKKNCLQECYKPIKGTRCREGEYESQWQVLINGKWIDAGSCRYVILK